MYTGHMTDRHELTPPVIDWQRLRESLTWDEARQHADRLRQRADQYAQPLKQADTAPEERLAMVTFDAAGERYGIDVLHVRGVRLLPRVTPLPGLPRFYPGVVNLRGQIVTVLDLHRFFNPGSSEIFPLRELVLVQSDDLMLGILAEHVHGVESLSRHAIQPVEYIQYAHGVTIDQRVILDIERLLSDDRLIVSGQDE